MKKRRVNPWERKQVVKAFAASQGVTVQEDKNSGYRYLVMAADADEEKLAAIAKGQGIYLWDE